MDFLLYLQNEFVTISNAPFTFLVGGALIATIVWTISRFQSSEQIANLESRIKLRDDKINGYERQLERPSTIEPIALSPESVREMADAFRQTFSELTGAVENRSFVRQLEENVEGGGWKLDLASNVHDARTSGAATILTGDSGNEISPLVRANDQALLLEAAPQGESGALPFSGTVAWDIGTDECGLPILLGHAHIPARKLGVLIGIRKNTDPSLPASHLIEITFELPDSFVGGSVSMVAGVLLKNEALVPGTALAGASAKIVGNSFIFALSALQDDVTRNVSLLRSQRWIDIAVVYRSGRNAIITLGKDEEISDLLNEILNSSQKV